MCKERMDAASFDSLLSEFILLSLSQVQKDVWLLRCTASTKRCHKHHIIHKGSFIMTQKSGTPEDLVMELVFTADLRQNQYIILDRGLICTLSGSDI